MRLIRTVAEGWEQKDVERVLPANTLDAVQRAWNEATRMIGVTAFEPRRSAPSPIRD
jgi:hypothetical protein